MAFADSGEIMRRSMMADSCSAKVTLMTLIVPEILAGWPSLFDLIHLRSPQPVVSTYQYHLRYPGNHFRIRKFD